MQTPGGETIKVRCIIEGTAGGRAPATARCRPALPVSAVDRVAPVVLGGVVGLRGPGEAPHGQVGELVRGPGAGVKAHWLPTTQSAVCQSVFALSLSELAAFAAYPGDWARYCRAVSGTVIILEVLSSLRYPVVLQ